MDSDDNNARTPSGRFKKGFPHNQGRKHTPEHIDKWRQAVVGRKQNPETVQKRIVRGARHGNWKGDRVGYYALHIWITRNFGKPTLCENPDCSFVNPKRYEWANISGNYTRDRSDWMQLCPSCHRKRDFAQRSQGQTPRKRLFNAA